MVALQSQMSVDQSAKLLAFWRWWLTELTAMIPARLRMSADQESGILVLEFSGASIQFSRWVNGDLSKETRLELSSSDEVANTTEFQQYYSNIRKPGDFVAINLPVSQYLLKTIQLPLIAAENLHQVVGFEMDRHTPFKPEQVYYHCEIQSQDRQSQSLAVSLIAAPRRAIELRIEQLATWGVQVQAVYALNGQVPAEGSVNLVQQSKVASDSSGILEKFSRVHLAAFALTAVMLALVIVIPIWKKRQIVVELNPIRGVHAKRRELEAMIQEYNYVLDRKNRSVPVTVLIDQVAGILTDDTWVQNLNLRNNLLQLSGETQSSSDLIGKLENAEIFNDVNFLAPLTKNREGKELYHLGASINSSYFYKGSPESGSTGDLNK
jgi:general secretion pathway protein L